jgi:TRAF3-interacting protein 1
MTEKLLSKPPFRFLHDSISSITSTTGFGEGLYQGTELDSAAITDKQGKIDYLDKIFNLVGICKVKYTPIIMTIIIIIIIINVS